MRENLTARICLIGLDARKFSCAKISMFTVVNERCGLYFFGVSYLPFSCVRYEEKEGFVKT